MDRGKIIDHSASMEAVFRSGIPEEPISTKFGTQPKNNGRKVTPRIGMINIYNEVTIYLYS